MIPTTNRITSLDIAVQSRIHLAIRYDDLTREQKQRIFKTFLNKLDRWEIKDREGIYDYIDDTGSKFKLNGRQIRNVVSSAISLARDAAKKEGSTRDGKLTKSDLQEVLEITEHFQEQLKDITKMARLANEATRRR